MLMPDPAPPALIAHIDRSYTYLAHDADGRTWVCLVPLHAPRRCVALTGPRVLLEVPHGA